MLNFLKINRFNKIFGWYAIVIGLIAAMSAITTWIPQGGLILRIVIYILFSLLGVISGILLLKQNKWGWLIAFIWSILQIPAIRIGAYFFNFEQILKLVIHYESPEVFLGINLVGLILAILLLVNRKNWQTVNTS